MKQPSIRPLTHTAETTTTRQLKVVEGCRDVSLDENGLLVVDGRLANLPLPKIDDVAPFDDDDDIDAYHARIQRAIVPLNVRYVMPKYDGACVHAVYLGTTRVVHTMTEFDCAEVRAAERMLGEAVWDEGITLAFALTAASTRIHLIYGADARVGLELDYPTLEALAKKINVPIVRRQLVKNNVKKVMDVVRTVDDVDTIERVKEGIVLVDAAGKRYQVRSWHHICVSRSTIPTKRWLKQLVHDASSMDALHDAVEALIGPLDAAVLARRMLVDLISSARSTSHGDGDVDALVTLATFLKTSNW